MSERSQQVNSLILNANDLVAVLNDRRYAITSLLSTTSAVSPQLTGVVADNEQELAPTLEKLNAVTAMLEKNRDNLAKMLPGVGEILSDTGRDRVERRLLQRADPQSHARRSFCSRSSTTPSGSGAASMPASRRTPPGRAQNYRSPSTAFRSQETFPMMETPVNRP